MGSFAFGNGIDSSFFIFRFRPNIVKEAIHHVLVEKLANLSYDGELCTDWTREISDGIKNKLKGMVIIVSKFYNLYLDLVYTKL